jgi:predicted nucleic acid-binding Zn ribbon protein
LNGVMNGVNPDPPRGSKIPLFAGKRGVTRNPCHSRRASLSWTMPTYVYETIPQAAGETAVRFEIRQGINDAKITHQPVTGIPVRRLVSGGFMLLKNDAPSIGSVTDSSWSEAGGR